MVEKSCSLMEFVGIVIGDIFGLVIVNVDVVLLEVMKFEKCYCFIGIFGVCIGVGLYIMVVDEVVKVINIEVVSIEFFCDIKGGVGYGLLIVLGGNDVFDVKCGIEVVLKELDCIFGDVYGNEVGYIELQYIVCVSYVLEKVFGVLLGCVCGIIVGVLVFVGVLMVDIVLKLVNVEVVVYSLLVYGISFSNEVILVIFGDFGVVCQVVIFVWEIGKIVLVMLGVELKNDCFFYI